MSCPSRNFKTQKLSIRRKIESAEGLSAVLRAGPLNIKHGLRSAVTHVLTPKSLNFFGSTICPARESVICPTRKLVSNTLNYPNEEIYDEEIYDEEIFKLPVIRFPFPRNPQMPEPNRLIL